MDRFYIIANELKDIGYQIRRELSAPSFWAETAH